MLKYVFLEKFANMTRHDDRIKDMHDSVSILRKIHSLLACQINEWTKCDAPVQFPRNELSFNKILTMVTMFAEPPTHKLNGQFFNYELTILTFAFFDFIKHQFSIYIYHLILNINQNSFDLT